MDNLFLATFVIFIIFTKIGGNTNINGEITNDKITSCEKRRLQTISKSDVAATLQDSCAFVDVFEEFRLQAVAIPL